MLTKESSEGNTLDSLLSQSRSLFFSFVGIAVISAGIILYDGQNTVGRYGTPVPLNPPPDTPTINELLLRAAMLITHHNTPSSTSHQNLHHQIDGVELGDAPSSSTMALSLEPLGLQSRIQLCTGSSTGTLTE